MQRKAETICIQNQLVAVTTVPEGRAPEIPMIGKDSCPNFTARDGRDALIYPARVAFIKGHSAGTDSVGLERRLQQLFLGAAQPQRRNLGAQVQESLLHGKRVAE